MPKLRAGIVPVTPLQQNCTLLYDEDTMKGAVVDPGGDVAQILRAVGEIGIDVERILLTHGHIDHAGGAAELKEKLQEDGKQAPIEGPHEADKFLLQSLKRTGAEYGILGARDVTPDRWLAEGDTVAVGSITFEIFHCPGHAPGHVIFVDRQARLAQIGDVLFKGSIGRTDFPYGDHQALISAIKEKLLPLGDDMVFICGHGPPGTLGEERRTNPFLV